MLRRHPDYRSPSCHLHGFRQLDHRSFPNTFSPIPLGGMRLRLVGGTIQQPAGAAEVSGLGSVSSAPRGANPTGTGVMSVQPCSGQEALIDV
jgi:hypothetical protein